MRRRDFVKAGAAGLFVGLFGGRSWTAEAAADLAASARPLRVGVVGCGWYGKCDLFRLLQVAPVEVVALCDVDARMLADAADQVAGRQTSHKKPRIHRDYRDLLKERDCDIILVDTPDHWHALPTIAAIEAGAHVYVQKPVSVDVREGEAMLAAARRHNRVVQVGTQRRSTPHLIAARDRVVKTGLLGTIGLVEVCSYYHMRTRRQDADCAPPEHLDWELYTGPAPMRPFNPIVHPRGWRGFMEYGNGIVGDMCIHMFDTVRWMLDLGWPQRIASAGGILMDKASRATISDTQTATFDYGTMQVLWQHRTWGAAPDPKYPWSATLYGDKGTLKFNLNHWDYVPVAKGGEALHGDVVMELDQYPADRTEKDLEKHVAPAIRRHMQDFLAAIASGGRPVADIEQGHTSSACCILANLAQRTGRTLAYDPAAGVVTGDAEATALLKRPYRAPWEHPWKG